MHIKFRTLVIQVKPLHLSFVILESKRSHTTDVVASVQSMGLTLII